MDQIEITSLEIWIQYQVKSLSEFHQIVRQTEERLAQIFLGLWFPTEVANGAFMIRLHVCFNWRERKQEFQFIDCQTNEK